MQQSWNFRNAFTIFSSKRHHPEVRTQTKCFEANVENAQDLKYRH